MMTFLISIEFYFDNLVKTTSIYEVIAKTTSIDISVIISVGIIDIRKEKQLENCFFLSFVEKSVLFYIAFLFEKKIISQVG